MIYLKRIWNSKFAQFTIVISLVFSYFYTAMTLVASSARSDTLESNNYVGFSLFTILVYPFVLSELFGKEGDRMIWGKRLYNWMYIAIVLVTGFSGITWYAYAETNSYLEPVTYLLSLGTAAVIYNRDKYFEAIKQSENPR